MLGVGRDADETEIKKAFRRLARELHPDINAQDPEAEEKFKEAAEAYEVLSDGERRRTYDAYGHEGLRCGGYAPSSRGSISDLFSAFFGAGGFDAAFGGGAERGGAVQGGDMAVGRLEMADAARGEPVEVGYDARECETCNGNGAEPGTPIVTCPRCRGAGQLQAVPRTAFGQMVRTAVCDRCGGDGRIAEQPCHTCDGAGMVAAHRRVSVDIPPGIADGQRIGSPAAATPASAAARPATCTWSCGCARTSASCATATTSSRWSTCRRRGGAGHDDPGADAGRRHPDGRAGGHAAGGDDHALRPRVPARPAAGAPATCAWSSTSSSPGGSTASSATCSSSSRRR